MVLLYVALLAPIAVVIADGWWIVRRSYRAENGLARNAIVVIAGAVFPPVLWFRDTRVLCLEALRVPAPIATGAAFLATLSILFSFDSVLAIAVMRIQSTPSILAAMAAYGLSLPGAHAVGYAIRRSGNRRRKELMQMEGQQ